MSPSTSSGLEAQPASTALEAFQESGRSPCGPERRSRFPARARSSPKSPATWASLHSPVAPPSTPLTQASSRRSPTPDAHRVPTRRATGSPVSTRPGALSSTRLGSSAPASRDLAALPEISNRRHRDGDGPLGVTSPASYAGDDPLQAVATVEPPRGTSGVSRPGHRRPDGGSAGAVVDEGRLAELAGLLE